MIMGTFTSVDELYGRTTWASGILGSSVLDLDTAATMRDNTFEFLASMQAAPV